MRDRHIIESIQLKQKSKTQETYMNVVKESKKSKKFKKLFFFFFSIQFVKNTGVCLYFERTKINCFLFMFKVFLEIFKDKKNASVNQFLIYKIDERN